MIEHINYIQILQHYCDLNEIPYHSSWDAVVDYMVQYPTRQIHYQTPYRRVFILLSQLMNNQIDLATMMNSGDITYPYSIGSAVSDDVQCIVQDISISRTTPIGYITMINIL